MAAKTHRWAKRIVKIFIALAIIAGVIFVSLPHIERIYYHLEYTDYIQEAADRYKVNPYIIAAMAKCESDFDPNATSSAGAVGVMQMMPETATEVANQGLVDSTKYPPQNLNDPEVSINYGAAYLRYLVERYHEMNPAIAAYNAGMGNVDKWLSEDNDIRASVGFSETEKYIQMVNRAKSMYEKLYPDAFKWDS